MVVLLYYRIIVLFAGEEFLKSVHIWRSYRQNGLIASHGLFEEHCPAWRLRFRQITCVTMMEIAVINCQLVNQIGLCHLRICWYWSQNYSVLKITTMNNSCRAQCSNVRRINTLYYMYEQYWQIWTLHRTVHWYGINISFLMISHCFYLWFKLVLNVYIKIQLSDNNDLNLYIHVIIFLLLLRLPVSTETSMRRNIEMNSANKPNKNYNRQLFSFHLRPLGLLLLA